MREPPLQLLYAHVLFRPFGTSEKFTVCATIAVRPNDPHDAVIADIGLAPHDAEGLVEATAEVVILRPAGGSNGTLLLELARTAAAS